MPPPRFAQKRAADTYDALLRASAKLFAERGYDATQTPDIARAAGVSTGAFYRYFKDKREALLEVLRRNLDEGRALVDAELRPDRFVGADVDDAIAMALGVLFQQVARNPGLARVYLTMSLTDPEVQQLRANAEAADRAALAHILAAVIPSSVLPNTEAAALVIQIAALEVAAERAGLRPHAGAAVDDEAVKLALRDMFRRYVFPAELSAKLTAKTPPRRKLK